MNMNTARVIKNRSIGAYHRFLALLVVGFAVNSVAAAAAGPPGQVRASSIPDTAVAYDLKEISAFDVPVSVRPYFTLGPYAECRREPNEQVKRYPKFQSEHPLYGTLVIGAQARHRAPGPSYQFALDESAGTGRGYDRLYFDRNRNADLTDDGYKTPAREAPQKDRFASSASMRANVWFDPLAVGVGASDSSRPPLEITPHLFIYDDDTRNRALVFFVGTKAHEGTIRVGDQEFKAVLGHDNAISGWFDQPDTALHLLAVDNSRSAQVSWGGGTQLSTLHRRGDTFYRFAAPPTGEKLFVWPYAGPFGTLEIGTGGRGIGRVSLTGSLISSEAAVSLTDGLGTPPLPRARSFRLPVGDYSPYMLSLAYDSLQCHVMRNYHADGRPRGRMQGQSQVYAIQIREDKPFVLDLSGKPQVLFALPARNQRVKLGGSLEVKAVLIDPALDIMFRFIMSRGQSLDPKVTIQRADGEIVGEGAMPFG
jgi:hypothetical protein